MGPNVAVSKLDYIMLILCTTCTNANLHMFILGYTGLLLVVMLFQAVELIKQSGVMQLKNIETEKAL